MIQLRQILTSFERKADKEHVGTRTRVNQDSNARFWTVAGIDQAHRRDDTKRARQENDRRKGSEAARNS